MVSTQDDIDLIHEAPADGVYIYGLFIESARWNHTSRCVAEQAPGIMVSRMPIIHFLPFEVKHQAEKRSFAPKNAGGPAGTAVDGGKLGPLSQQPGPPSVEQTPERGARHPSRGRRSTQAQPQRREPSGAHKESLTGQDQLEGEEDTDLENPARYLCPVYKTSSRAGALSTTGQSTNYILSVSLPINPAEHSAEHWTLRGTALLTMLDD